MRDMPAKDGSVEAARDPALVYRTKRSETATPGRFAAALREEDGLVLATDPYGKGEAAPGQGDERHAHTATGAVRGGKAGVVRGF